MLEITIFTNEMKDEKASRVWWEGWTALSKNVHSVTAASA